MPFLPRHYCGVLLLWCAHCFSAGAYPTRTIIQLWIRFQRLISRETIIVAWQGTFYTRIWPKNWSEITELVHKSICFPKKKELISKVASGKLVRFWPFGLLHLKNFWLWLSFLRSDFSGHYLCVYDSKKIITDFHLFRNGNFWTIIDRGNSWKVPKIDYLRAPFELSRINHPKNRFIFWTARRYNQKFFLLYDQQLE